MPVRGRGYPRLIERPAAQGEAYWAGTLAGAGSFCCESCGYAVALHELDEIPVCPVCHGGPFKRASLFGRGAALGPSRAPEVESPEWLPEVRETLPASGHFLAWDDDSGPQVRPIEGEWTRVGRSLAADIRFDDPTVSRRHALVLREGEGVRVLDDRSLNGVFVDGERVESHDLSDGDEVAVGRFRLYYMRAHAQGRDGADNRIGHAVS